MITRIRLTVRVPGTVMNVQQRPSCTFILLPTSAQGRRTLESRQCPASASGMNVNFARGRTGVSQPQPGITPDRTPALAGLRH